MCKRKWPKKSMHQGKMSNILRVPVFGCFRLEQIQISMWVFAAWSVMLSNLMWTRMASVRHFFHNAAPLVVVFIDCVEIVDNF